MKFIIWNTVRTYLRLGRIHSSVLTGVTPCVVAAATGATLSIYHYTGLFIIGLVLHISGFIYNEICDLTFDKISDKLKGKSLVNGSVPIRNAKNNSNFFNHNNPFSNHCFFQRKQ